MQFSIIIPAKNEAANIGRCLDSIDRMAWDASCYEVIVIDNGSTDGTVEIARQHGTAVYLKPELTISGLRNFAAGQASGDLLAFLDADCTVDTQWLCEAARYLKQTDVVCFGSPPVVPENATWVQKAWFEVRRKSVPAGETDWLESMNMFVRRDAFISCGGFDENLITCEDYDLSLRLKRVGKMMNDSAIIAVHHGEAATVRHFFSKERWRGISNVKGVMQHGIVMAEMPSLLAPSAHCILLAAATVGLPLFSDDGYRAAVIAFLMWQVLLFLSSFRKNRIKSDILRVTQLYALLNVYFLARGLAIFGGRRP